MKPLTHLMAAVLTLGLAACASEYTESEAPKNLTIDNATARVDVRFAPGSTQLAAADVGRLRGLAASGSGASRAASAAAWARPRSSSGMPGVHPVST